MGVLDNDIEEALPGDVAGQSEGRRLVDPHQRRMDGDAPVEPEAERHLHRLDGVVAAIRIAGIIGFAHAGDDMAGAAPIRQGTGEGEKDQVARRHERVRQTAVGKGNRRLRGQRAVGNSGERVD